MTNSISLSSDLNTLFLIEESQVVAFPLFAKQGILIGSLQNQLVAATNKDAFDKNIVKVDIIEITKSQIQFYYSEKLEQAFIIIIDIMAERGSDAPDFGYRALTYDLAKENIVLRRTEETVLLYRVPKRAFIIKDEITPFNPNTGGKGKNIT